jgi:hypothetical protein
LLSASDGLSFKSIRKEFIKLSTPRESNRNARKFPNVIGARDGCHVKVNRPQHHQDSYINGKGFHSVLIQGIVETRKLFLDVRVYCGELGSPHDARFLRKSAIYRKPENRGYFGNTYIVGDFAYPSLPWFVPPFKDNG